MNDNNPFEFNQAIPLINEDTEFFPLMSQEDEEEMNNEETPETLSILPYATQFCSPVWSFRSPSVATNPLNW